MAASHVRTASSNWTTSNVFFFVLCLLGRFVLPMSPFSCCPALSLKLAVSTFHRHTTSEQKQKQAYYELWLYGPSLYHKSQCASIYPDLGWPLLVKARRLLANSGLAEACVSLANQQPHDMTHLLKASVCISYKYIWLLLLYYTLVYARTKPSV